MIERESILAVDPGGTTGWVVYHPGFGRAVWESDFEHLVKMFNGPGVGFRRLLKVIVCERYTINAETLRKTRQPEALEVIGFLKSVALQEEIPFILQSPGDAKNFATDERLKAVEWYCKGMDHGNDALRHLMLYLVKNRLMDPPRVTA